MSDYLNATPHSAEPPFPVRPVTLAYLLILQALPAFGILALSIPSYTMFHQPIPWLGISLTIGAVAFCLTYLTSYPWRYRIIEGAIAPVIWLILHLLGII